MYLWHMYQNNSFLCNFTLMDFLILLKVKLLRRVYNNCAKLKNLRNNLWLKMVEEFKLMVVKESVVLEWGWWSFSREWLCNQERLSVVGGCKGKAAPFTCYTWRSPSANDAPRPASDTLQIQQPFSLDTPKPWTSRVCNPLPPPIQPFWSFYKIVTQTVAPT